MVRIGEESGVHSRGQYTEQNPQSQYLCRNNYTPGAGSHVQFTGGGDPNREGVGRLGLYSRMVLIGPRMRLQPVS